MYLGLDLGTSALKALLVDEAQRVVASVSRPLAVQRPAAGHSEQNPADWWAATLDAVDALRRDHPAALAAVRGIGVAGQMHGAILLDAAGEVLRPAILWNDVRAVAECRALEAAFPALREVSGNIAMPGFTAPKLLWVRAHEPDTFARTATVLLPKAWLLFRLTGERVEEMSDASGTLWLDVAARDWSDAALAATGLSRDAMPRLVEGSEAAGTLRPELASRWGMGTGSGATGSGGRVVLAGGAGDNAAGAVGLGAIRPGDAFVSLGTSGVLFAATDRFRPYPQAAVHAFCHALPGLWHQMGVTLSAAASLAWWSGVAGVGEQALLDEVGPDPAKIRGPGAALFLPYLGGERTPHNDGAVRGAFSGLSHDTGRAALTQAVLEGVAFSMRDCLDALAASGTQVASADVIGGGSRSRLWVSIIANVLGVPLHRLADGEHGGAFGAARLARMAATGESPESLCAPPTRGETIDPDPGLAAAYAARHAEYGALYRGIAGAPRTRTRSMSDQGTSWSEGRTRPGLPALDGRVAVVTGAARGIGRAIARRYAAEGASVVIADLDAAGARALADEIGASAIAIAFDVTRQDSIDALMAATVQRFGRLDILVNNAGVFDLAPILEITRESYARVFAVNVEGLLFTLQAAARQMIAQNGDGNGGGNGARRGGSIINFASQAGRRGEGLVGVYCASKAAVISLTQSAGLDLIRHGINVNAIAPGVVDAEHWDDVDRRFARYENLQPGEKKRSVAAAVPIGRMAQPEEIAGLAAFLAGEDARYVVAQTYGIDGGNWMA